MMAMTCARDLSEPEGPAVRGRTRRSPAPVSGFATLTLAALVGCGGREPAATTVVEELYAAIAATGTRGAPTQEQLEVLAPLLTGELRSLLARARALNDSLAIAEPGEKPPFAEGDLFSSLYQGPTRAEAVSVSDAGDHHRVVVRFTYDLGAPPVEWFDHVIVHTERGRPVVADVEYHGGWPFGNHGSLVASVRDALEFIDSLSAAGADSAASDSGRPMPDARGSRTAREVDRRTRRHLVHPDLERLPGVHTIRVSRRSCGERSKSPSMASTGGTISLG
jgi:hypothetical protein